MGENWEQENCGMIKVSGSSKKKFSYLDGKAGGKPLSGNAEIPRETFPSLSKERYEGYPQKCRPNAHDPSRIGIVIIPNARIPDVLYAGGQKEQGLYPQCEKQPVLQHAVNS